MPAGSGDIGMVDALAEAIGLLFFCAASAKSTWWLAVYSVNAGTGPLFAGAAAHGLRSGSLLGIYSRFPAGLGLGENVQD